MNKGKKKGILAGSGRVLPTGEIWEGGQTRHKGRVEGSTAAEDEVKPRKECASISARCTTDLRGEWKGRH